MTRLDFWMRRYFESQKYFRYKYAYSSATLGNAVFEDLNANGIQDAGEPGIAGVTVKLLDAHGSFLKATTTDANGVYSFNVAAGTYSVKYALPTNSGYLFSPVNQGGDDTKDSDADPHTGLTDSITLHPGESNLSVDAGLYKLASLGNFVFLDENGNGLQDGAEPGVDHVTVELLQHGNVIKSTTTTDGGFYEFSGLTPGEYQVRVIAPEGFEFTATNQGSDDSKDSDVDGSGLTAHPVTLYSGEHNATIDAGLIPVKMPHLSITTQFIDHGIGDIIIPKHVDKDDDFSNGVELVEQNFLALKRGGTLLQNITVHNTGNGNASSTPIKVTAANPFVELLEVQYKGIDTNGDGIVDATPDIGFTFTKTNDANDTQTLLVNLEHVPAHSSVILEAVSQVTARGDTSLNSDFTLDYELTNDTGHVVFGTKHGSGIYQNGGSLYLSETGYAKNGGSTLFNFSRFGFEDYKSEVDLWADGSVEKSLFAQPVRGSGILENKQTGEDTEYVLLDLEGDVDARARTTYRNNSQSGLLTSGELFLVWNNSPRQVFSQLYQDFRDGSGVNTYDNLISLIEEGLYGRSLSTDETFKNGKGAFGGTRYDPNTGSNQAEHLNALSGDVEGTSAPTNYLVIDFPLEAPNSGRSLQEVLHNLGTYYPDWNSFDEIIVNITTASAIPVTLFNYGAHLPWFEKVTGIILPPGTDALDIRNGSNQEHLDLSNISIIDANGEPTGIDLVSSGANKGTKNIDRITATPGPDQVTGGNNGDDVLNGKAGNDILTTGNGKDTLIGGLGFDTLTGGNGKDRFVLAAGHGTDTFTDFKKNLDVIGLVGLSASQLTFSAGQLKFGDEVLAVFTGTSDVSNIHQIRFEAYHEPI